MHFALVVSSSPWRRGSMRFVLVALLLAVVAGEYDACTRPDAVYASWDQAFSRRTPAHTPCATALILPSPPCATATLMRRMLIANHAAWTGARHILRLRRYRERR